MTSRDEVLRTLRAASTARIRAAKALEKAQDVEDRAIQDAAEVLTRHGEGTELTSAAQRSREHVRKVLDPKFGRGRHAPTPSD